MAIYTIKIKKGDCEYSFSGNDKEFISAYIDKVLSELNVNKPSLIESRPVPLLTAGRDDAQRRNIEIEKAENSLLRKIYPIKPIQIPVKEEHEETSLADYSVFLKPNNTVLKPRVEEKKVEQERVTIDTFNFENILEDKIKNPVFEEEKTVPRVDFDVVLRMKNPESLIDYLIITAYYLFENENKKNFQLKQLNAKLYNSMKMVIDRKTIQKALDNGLIMVVSNKPSDNGAIVYSLTQRGREYYVNGYA